MIEGPVIVPADLPREEAHSRRESPLEAHVPADLLAESPTLFRRDAPSERTRGHATRLQERDGAEREERRRHARRPAGAGRRHDDDGTRRTRDIQDRRKVGVDGHCVLNPSPARCGARRVAKL